MMWAQWLLLLFVPVIFADAYLMNKRDEFWCENQKHISPNVTLHICVLLCVQRFGLNILLYGYADSIPFKVKIRRCGDGTVL